MLMGFLRKSLMARLTFNFLLLSLITVSAVGYLAYYGARQTLENSVLSRLDAIADLKEAEFNRWITDARGDIKLMAESSEVWQQTERLTQTEDAETVIPSLKNYLTTADATQPDFQEIFIIEAASGTILFSTNHNNIGKQDTAENYFIVGLLGTTVSNVYNSPTNGRPTMTVATPIHSSSGETIAVLAAHLDLNYMDRVILGREGLGATGETYLVDSLRILVAANDRVDFEVAGADVPTVQSVGIDNALASQSGAALYTNYAGEPVLGNYRWLNGPKLALLAEIPQEEAFAPARQLGFTIVGAGLASTLFLAVAIYVLARRVAQPIEDVTKTAVQVAAGDLYATAGVFTDDEIGVLARTFNQMTERLRRSYDSLETRVMVRTAELAKRAQQLDVINQVARNANSQLELNTLLPSVTALIRDRFNYYAVLILLVNEETGGLFLSAANTAENVDLKTADWHSTPEAPGIINHVAQTGAALVVNDVRQEPRYLITDLLPRTRSELALPLSIGNKVLGVLDLQSIHPNVFSLDDVQVLQTLSDQIAVAIRNAELFQTAQLSRAEAEEANRLKSQFLANMSHELRTPLNAVINFAYLLSMGVEGQLTTGQADMINRIQDAGRHLLGVVNDILDLAKIESGRIEIFLENVLLQEVVKGVLSTASGLVKGRPIELRQEIPADLPAIKADRGRIRQVLLNLVSNAAKFTEEGHITVCAWGDDNWVTISVQDTGIGMATEDIPKAFAEFVQLDGGLTRRVGGTGLGLAISQKFVEMHGGHIWAESTVGQGSIFYVQLPRSKNGN